MKRISRAFILVSVGRYMDVRHVLQQWMGIHWERHLWRHPSLSVLIWHHRWHLHIYNASHFSIKAFCRHDSKLLRSCCKGKLLYASKLLCDPLSVLYQTVIYGPSLYASHLHVPVGVSREGYRLWIIWILRLIFLYDSLQRTFMWKQLT